MTINYEDTSMVLEVWKALEELVDDFDAEPYRPLLERHRPRIEEIKMYEVVRGLTAWGHAIKWFVYGCVSPSGKVNAHGTYINIIGPDDLCSFCRGPVTERPRQRAVLKEKP